MQHLLIFISMLTLWIPLKDKVIFSFTRIRLHVNLVNIKHLHKCLVQLITLHCKSFCFTEAECRDLQVIYLGSLEMGKYVPYSLWMCKRTPRQMAFRPSSILMNRDQTVNLQWVLVAQWLDYKHNNNKKRVAKMMLHVLLL